MSKISETIQGGDWKTEKHVPFIECSDKVRAGENLTIKVVVGREIAHPNTTEHHIRWIQLYYQAEGEKFPAQVGVFEFTAHGESIEGPNKGSAYSIPEIIASLKVSRPGTIYATSYCNIHGLWESKRELGLA